MPIYEYQCQKCGALKEAIQRISDPPLMDCEVCDGEMKRLISAPAFQFKGSGWYVTDYADKNKGKSSKEESSSTSDSGKKSSESASSKSSDGGSSSSKSDSKKTAKSA